MIDLIEQHRAELGDVCRRYHVKTLEVFGSAASDQDFDTNGGIEAAGRLAEFISRKEMARHA